MTIQNVVSESLEAVLTTAIGSADDVYVVNPSRETIAELAGTLDDASDPPTVRLLAAERPLKDVLEDFLIASRTADLIDAHVLSIRVLDGQPVNSLAVTDDAVVSLVTAVDSAAGLTTTDEDFVAETRAYYDDEWADAEEFSLRTPPLSRVRSTLAEDLGDAVREDFDAVLDSIDDARGDDDGVDEVTISLLVAARNEELLYDISKWGEDIGLASKATFSRKKTQLEERGLLETEKVPIDVGRPRLRLLLGDDRLREAPLADLADVAAEMLAA